MSTPSASRSEPGRRPLASLSELPEGTVVVVAGRILQAHGDLHTLEDSSGRVTLHAAPRLGPGTLCTARGPLRDGVVHAEHVEVHGGREDVFRSASDYSRLHTGSGRVLGRLRERARLTRAVRQFFEARDYLEVDTPCAVPSPGLDLHLSAFAIRRPGPPRYLMTSPEYQMKRLLSAGADRIFQLARCFRSDEAGPHHEAEFTLLEWYGAFRGMDALMDETEALVRAVAHTARPEGELGTRGCGTSEPFERLTVREAFRRHAQADSDALAETPETFFRVLVEAVEPHLGRARPTFLTHYPASMASLARLDPRDPRVAERFELYADGVELCNGFGELTCPEEQRVRFENDQRARAEAGAEVYPIDERFLEALHDGMPPSAGNALGLDRLFMLALGLDDIQAIQAFPDATL